MKTTTTTHYFCGMCDRDYLRPELAEECERECKAYSERERQEGEENRWINFWYGQRKWSEETFGHLSGRGPNGPLRHLAKECVEAVEEQDLARKRVEIADCLFLVVDAAWRAGFTPGTLLDTALNKLEVNKSRKWGPKSSEGAVEHIRGGE